MQESKVAGRRRAAWVAAAAACALVACAPVAPRGGAPAVVLASPLSSASSDADASPRTARNMAPALLDHPGPRADAERAAVRALLLNLVDDAEPPRFADPQWSVVCGERSRVWLGTREVLEGEPVPAGSFVLDWALDGACPLGPDGPLLDGALRMLVVREDERGFVPVVLARR